MRRTSELDHFVYDGRSVNARVMGAFEVVDQKIAAWRDSFDVPNAAPETSRQEAPVS